MRLGQFLDELERPLLQLLRPFNEMLFSLDPMSFFPLSTSSDCLRVCSSLGTYSSFVAVPSRIMHRIHNVTSF